MTVIALETPFTEAVTVEVTVERLETDVRVAVATPSLVVPVAVMVPSVVEKVTTVPSSIRLPYASVTVPQKVEDGARN